MGLIVACATAAAADQTAWFTRSWQTDDGLPNNQVMAVSQGPDGYLWVGTPAGLARFDGIRFREFSNLGSNSHEDQGVNSIVPSQSGGLWIKMRRWPIFYIDPSLSTVTPAADGLPNERPAAMMEDKEGCLWVGYPDSIWQIRNGIATKLTGEQGIASGFVMDVNGAVWVAKGNHVGVFRNNQFKSLMHPKFRPHLAAAHPNGVWVAAGGQLLKCDQEGRVENCGFYQTDSHAAPTEILEDHTGAVWIGTDSGGLFRHDASGFTRIETSHPGILSLGEDREGNIWAGTAGGGLDRISPRSVQLEGLDDGSSLIAIQSVCETTNGVLWGVSQSGLLVSRTNAQWRAIQISALRTEAITCVAADRSGGVWVGTRNRRLVHMRDGNLTVMETNGVVGRIILALLPASNGDLWMSEQVPVSLQCLHAGQLRTVPMPGYAPRITAMAEDGSGNIWVGSERGDLMRAEENHLVKEDAAAPPSHRSILSLHVSPDDALWIGYEGAGLGRLKEGHFSRIGTERGLFDDNISQIVPDDEGWYWFGGERGLFKVRRAELEAVMNGAADHVSSIHYGQNEGLFSVEANSANASPFIAPGAFRGKDGRLWIPLRKALAAVDPKVMHSNPEPPPPLLTQAAMDGQIIASYGGVPANGKVANLKTLRAPLELPPNHRRLEFDFTAINLSEPENIRFRYRLDGLDDNWVTAETRSAGYSRLTAGDYKFNVEASNGDGPWNQAPVTLAFTVLPFFWQTWWFRVVVLAMFTSLVIAVVRYISFRRLRAELLTLEQRAALDKERSRIARDLHDDLGCSLNQVALTLDMAQSDPANGTIQRCSSMVRQTARSVDEIVWAINPRNDTLRYMVDYISQFAVEFLHAAGIRCRVDLPDNVPDRLISPEARHNLFLVVKETLNNVARHARANEVQLRIAVDSQQVAIAIEDNGCGFANQTDNASCDGLRNLRQRMQEVGGRLQIESRVGAGTRVSFLYSWPSQRQ